MSKAFLILLLLLGNFAAASDFVALPKPKPTPHNPAIEHAHLITYEIEFHTKLINEKCSATAIGPHALLTASHCEGPTEDILIDFMPHKVLGIARDENEHTVFFVDDKFYAWAKVSTEAMQLGDDVFLFGNPGDMLDVLRKGYVSKMSADMDDDKAEFALDFNGWPGDSGAGIFNAKGELVGVVSMGHLHESEPDHTQWPALKMMGGFPLRFTAEDYAEYSAEKMKP
jgi:hypothetical protein